MDVCGGEGLSVLQVGLSVEDKHTDGHQLSGDMSSSQTLGDR